MSTYRVQIHGQRLVVRRWLFFRKRLGFFATRYVDAPSADVAKVEALRALRGEPRLALPALEAPQLTVEEVDLVPGPAASYPVTGIVFYEGEPAEPSSKVT